MRKQDLKSFKAAISFSTKLKRNIYFMHRISQKWGNSSRFNVNRNNGFENEMWLEVKEKYNNCWVF